MLLRDLLERWKTRFLNTWKLFQKKNLFDALDDIDNKYNITVYKTIKKKPIDITSDFYVK